MIMGEEDLLKLEISALNKEISELENTLFEKRYNLYKLRTRLQNEQRIKTKRVNDLSNEDIARFSRQLIIPSFGATGQIKLRNAAVLIVGVGGLGCPAAQYLAAAGVGKLGLVDYDVVEKNNLHRQILHNEENIGQSKVESAKEKLTKLYNKCQFDLHQDFFNTNKALTLIEEYDLVLDCTDNMPTRYFINDLCVLSKKPFVSGSALQLDGQVTVYNYLSGPCYRCLFPQPAPAETVNSCSDGGILGAVTGVIGAIQALEAIKIIVNLGTVLSQRMLIFDGANCSFRNIKLRPKRSDCVVCGENPSVKELINYEEFCGQAACEKSPSRKILLDKDRLSVEQYAAMKKKHLLIDVRTSTEFGICQLPNSQNIPINDILNNEYKKKLGKELCADIDLPIVVVCRRGNDSQIAVQHLQQNHANLKIFDIIGGLHAWHHQVDMNFPIY